MNIGVYACGILVIPFSAIALLFALLKERAAILVSGFNSLPRKEQSLYDKARISQDVRNQCFAWAGLMLAGALLSCFFSSYMAIPTFMIWLYWLFKDIHLNPRKAFEKYLLK